MSPNISFISTFFWTLKRFMWSLVTIDEWKNCVNKRVRKKTKKNKNINNKKQKTKNKKQKSKKQKKQKNKKKCVGLQIFFWDEEKFIMAENIVQKNLFPLIITPATVDDARE